MTRISKHIQGFAPPSRDDPKHATNKHSVAPASKFTAIRLCMWDFGHCDPKKCSGRRLVRQGWLRELPIHNSKSSPAAKFNGIILSPRARIPLTQADTPLIMVHGLAVVDCSWARVEDVPWNKVFGGNAMGRERLLPPGLVASNAVNYGKLDKLNCAEALLAGLLLTVCPINSVIATENEEAEENSSSSTESQEEENGVEGQEQENTPEKSLKKCMQGLLDAIPYGRTFVKLNEDFLTAMHECPNPTAVPSALLQLHLARAQLDDEQDCASSKSLESLNDLYASSSCCSSDLDE